MPKPSNPSVYVISVAAELAGVHPQTLRIYERKGLLYPERTAGNTRRYSEADIARLLRIQQLTQEEGVNLAGVRRIMELDERVKQLEAAVAAAEHRAEETRNEAAAAVGAVHRSYRRDLVPLSAWLVPTTPRPRRGR